MKLHSNKVLKGKVTLLLNDCIRRIEAGFYPEQSLTNFTAVINLRNREGIKNGAKLQVSLVRRPNGPEYGDVFSPFHSSCTKCSGRKINGSKTLLPFPHTQNGKEKCGNVKKKEKKDPFLENALESHKQLDEKKMEAPFS